MSATEPGRDRERDLYDCAACGIVIGCDDDECCKYCGHSVDWIAAALQEKAE